MLNLPSLPICSLIVIFLLNQAYSFPHDTQNGYQGNDLFTATSLTFQKESIYWGLMGFIGASTTTICDNMPILGGPGVLASGGYFQKTYYALPPHDVLYFRIGFYIIDNWQSVDTVTVDFDGRSFTIGDMTLSQPYLSTNLCGDTNYPDMGVVYFMGKVNHSAGTANMKIFSNITNPPTVASFGIRRVNVLFGTKADPNEPEMSCNIANVTVIDKSCGCPTGSYYNTTSSSCMPCHSYCADCFGPLPSQCFACNTDIGASFINNECTKCANSCIDCRDSTNHTCLICADSTWHRWDLTCPDTCDSPPYSQEILNNVKLCKPPCQPGEYYLSNKSCSANCPSPLNKYSNNFGGFCDLKCPAGQYYYPNDTCLPTCDSPLVASYLEGVLLKCDLPCPNGQFVYPNGTCLGSCNSPLIVTVASQADMCVSPCNGSTPYFYEHNTTCQSTCNSPFVLTTYENTISKCDKPCLNGQYLYPNGTCLNTCGSPFIIVVDQGVDRCASPCNGSTPYFYEHNTTCQSTCDSPFVLTTYENIISKCDKPCLNGQYLYPNNASCLGSCQTPLLIEVNNGVATCISPCKTPTPYFNETDGSCLVSCDTPFIIVQQEFFQKCTNEPQLPSNSPTEEGYNTLTSDEAKQVRLISSAVEVGGNVLGATTALAMVFGSANPAVSTLAGFVKMLPYVRYININYPPKLQLMLDNLNSSLISFSFGVPMPEELQDQFTQRSLPYKFEDYGFYSSFFVNYWPIMSSLVILMGVSLSLHISTILLKKNKQICQFLKGLKVIIQWNFFLMIFCGNYDGIIIPTSLELRTVVFDSFASVMSFLFCLSLNIAAIFSFFLAFYIIKDIRKSKLQIKPDNTSMPAISPETRWQEYQLFYKGSKDDSVIRHMYIIPYLARLYIFNLVIANLYEHPLAQAIIIVIMSVLILSSMLLLRPFVSNVVFCQHVSDETLMLIVNICMLTLGALDNLNVENTTARANLGDVIIYCNLLFNVTANIYLVTYLLVGFKAAYTNMKLHKERGLLSWLTALLAPYESGGMDLEVIPIKENSPMPTPSAKEVEDIQPNIYLTDINKRSSSLTNHQRRDSSISNSDFKEKQEPDQLLLGSQDRRSSKHLSPDNIFSWSQSETSPLKPSSFAKDYRQSMQVDLNTSPKGDTRLSFVQPPSTEALFIKTRRSTRKSTLGFLSKGENGEKGSLGE